MTARLPSTAAEALGGLRPTPGLGGTVAEAKFLAAGGGEWDILGVNELQSSGAHSISAGAAAAAVAQRFGASVSEGYEILVIDETLAGLAAIETNLTEEIPIGAVILSVQANIETLVVAAGTSVKVGIGATADPDLYGLTADLAQNTKSDLIPTHGVLGGALQLAVQMCATAGGIGDSAASAGSVRVRIVYAALNSLDDA